MTKINREEHTAKIMAIKEKIHDIDDGSITQILADLSDDYGSVLADIDNTNLQNEKLKKDNENLRDTNMRLFLKIEKPSENNPEEQEETNKKLSFENLFNEKGELK